MYGFGQGGVSASVLASTESIEGQHRWRDQAQKDRQDRQETTSLSLSRQPTTITTNTERQMPPRGHPKYPQYWPPPQNTSSKGHCFEFCVLWSRHLGLEAGRSQQVLRQRHRSGSAALSKHWRPWSVSGCLAGSDRSCRFCYGLYMCIDDCVCMCSFVYTYTYVCVCIYIYMYLWSHVLTCMNTVIYLYIKYAFVIIGTWQECMSEGCQ